MSLEKNNLSLRSDSMGRTFPKEIKNYAISHRKQGKTIKEIRHLCKLKGYNVSEDAIKRWVKAKGINHLDQKQNQRSDLEIYEQSIANTRKKENLFKLIKPGDKVLAEYTSIEDGECVCGTIEVINKYPFFLMGIINNHKITVDKMSVLEIVD